MVFGAILHTATRHSMLPFPDDLPGAIQRQGKKTYLDRHGRRLNLTYDHDWNLDDRADFHAIPEFLRRAFVISEDKRFYSHRGVDWLARLNALKQNILAGEVVRGASTLTEQVVRMLHPRPRTFWSRWIEGFEASALERKFSKVEILEFYLNQVPYKARRRGVAQASHYYFNRDLSTLNHREMLALAVLVRAPRWLDPGQRRARLDRAVADLHRRLRRDTGDSPPITGQELALEEARLGHDLSHFIRYADAHIAAFVDKDGGAGSGSANINGSEINGSEINGSEINGSEINGSDISGLGISGLGISGSGVAPSNFHTAETGGSAINTTIDLELQIKIQAMLDTRLDGLKPRAVNNGAALVIDHETNEILAWVVGYAGRQGRPFNKIDAATTARQPGSALKPFLYASAIRAGWTAATMLDDSPLEESVGSGMHTYHNYSRDHYGLISVREALGNSLNIPAVRAIQFVGAETFLSFLYDAGIKSLSGHPNVYGDGLALGNGELTLLELIQAYTVLARMGDYKPLSFIEGKHRSNGGHRALSEDIASLIADILSDPAAREKEFGRDSVLNFPFQTAVKTGTSSDYRDAWAIGFNDRYTAGVWMGNLDYSAMSRVTGASGPALTLRAIFNELNRNRDVRPLYFSDNLIERQVCAATGAPADGDCDCDCDCDYRDEWFVAGALPRHNLPRRHLSISHLSISEADTAGEIRIRKPGNGLRLAMDPRIPDESEYFEFALTDIPGIEKVHWYVNQRLVATTHGPRYHWRLSRGGFTTRAEVHLAGRSQPVTTEEVAYTVH